METRKKFMAEACNIELAKRLGRLCKELGKVHPGVWKSETLKSLERLADQLPELTEHEVDPTVIAAWQPTLVLIPYDGECRMCGKERPLNGSGRCSECEQVWNS